MAVCTGQQPGQLHEKADFARVSETLVIAKRADQAHQDGWTSGAACQEVGVSAEWVKSATIVAILFVVITISVGLIIAAWSGYFP